MLKFKFGAWAVVLMLTAFSFSACRLPDLRYSRRAL